MGFGEAGIGGTGIASGSAGMGREQGLGGEHIGGGKQVWGGTGKGREQVWGAGTRINRGRRGTAISGIWPSRSRYRENDRDNRDKWNPKKRLQKLYFGISSRPPCFKQALNLFRATLSLHKHL